MHTAGRCSGRAKLCAELCEQGREADPARPAHDVCALVLVLELVPMLALTTKCAAVLMWVRPGSFAVNDIRDFSGDMAPAE